MKQKFPIIKLFAQRVGVDRAVAYAVSGKILQIVAGIVNIILIARFITRSEQGYLYTFQSLLAFQILFDLSLPAVLVQFAGHEMAHLKWQAQGTVEGESPAKSRLASLIRISFKWYSIAAVLMLVLLTSGGYIFFKSKEVAHNPVNWQAPWMLICTAASIMIIFTPILGIIEGCGKVAEVAAFRIIQDSVGALIYWIALSSGLKLFALPALFFTRVTVLLIYLLVVRGRFLIDLKSTNVSRKISFSEEIWPFQWRFLVCSISSLLASSLMIPIVFAAQGPIVAGQLGMTLSITSALLMVSMAWIYTKIPLFCNLVALKKYNKLDRTFRTVGRHSFSVMLALSAGIIIMIVAVNKLLPSFAVRLADPATAGLLILAVLMAFPNIAGSTYLRAHKREVTAPANISTSLITLLLIYFASRHEGLLYIGIVQAVSSGVLSFWVYLLLRRYRKQWHAAPYKEIIMV
jgi:O-antigen/teichoic acid export membrane protein